MKVNTHNHLGRKIGGNGRSNAALPTIHNRPNHIVAQMILWICFGIASVFSISASAAGVWTPLVNLAPDGVELMLLLPDGTVMVADEPGGNDFSASWFLLTPDNQ